MTTFALTEAVFDEARGWLALDVETAGVLLARSARSGALLLARTLRPVPESAYQERSAYRLAIASGGYVPALREAADLGEIACFIHSHPGGRPDPSELDEIVDQELRELFPARTEQPFYVGLIIGGTTEAPELAGRIFHRDGRVETIDRFRVAGRRIRILGAPEEAANQTFDRQIRAFGADGQAVLKRLRVGVVGAGGTGSAVVEQLVRLGVGHLVLADDDVVSSTNLTRIHQSSMGDVGSPKIDVAARLATELGAGTVVDRVVGRVTEQSVARAFTDCDLIFGCTDDHAGRAVLSRLAYWYLIPVIDMGVVVDSRAGQIEGIFARVTSCGPGSPCLLCRGVVDPIRMRDDMLSPEERTERAAEGYAPGLAEPDPSVVAYTTFTASLAVAEFLGRLFGIGEAIDEMRARIHNRDIRSIAGEPRPGHYCSDESQWGRGDEDPFLGQTW